MADLVVFDLDGTLVDSRRDLATATNAMLVDLGGRPLAEAAVAGMVGEGAGVLVRRALAASGLDPECAGALDRFLAHYDESLLEHTRPYPGIAEMLDALRGRRMAVLTNKPAHATERILEGLDLRRYFGAVIGGDSPHGRKPDPAGLAHLASTAGVRCGRTLLVGDSPVDLATARNAGTRICLCRYGFGYRFDAGAFRGDEWFVDAPGELVALVDAA